MDNNNDDNKQLSAMNQPVMNQSDPNDDPFAGLYTQEKVLTSPVEYGSSTVSSQESTTAKSNATQQKGE